VARWEPNARGRLEQAALELYVERGYEQTTVADIAERAGLTERTFFRHFSDKREVLFGGGSALEDALTEAVASAPASASPIAAVADALDGLSPFFHGRREIVRRRQSVIAAHPELQERELIKMASWASTLAAALRKRGVKDPAAALTAEAGIAAFRVAYARWVKSGTKQDLSKFIRQSFDDLKSVTADA